MGSHSVEYSSYKSCSFSVIYELMPVHSVLASHRTPNPSQQLSCRHWRIWVRTCSSWMARKWEWCVCVCARHTHGLHNGSTQVSIVGEVMEVKEQPTSITYVIDDRTGPWVKVQRWLEDQSTPMDPSERSACREGMYVRAVGNVKTFNNVKSITAFSVRAVEDFNEVSKHLSQVMVAHLAAVKGAPVVSLTPLFWVKAGTQQKNLHK